jgi:hypothetical protein
VAAPKQDNH